MQTLFLPTPTWTIGAVTAAEYVQSLTQPSQNLPAKTQSPVFLPVQGRHPDLDSILL